MGGGFIFRSGSNVLATIVKMNKIIKLFDTDVSDSERILMP